MAIKDGSGRRRAVVVGIDDYPGTLDDLPSCVADARRATETLRSTFGFDDIVELHDDGATVDAVVAALGDALTGATEADRVVFFYSGHGTQTIRGEELRESLCLYDRLFHDDALVEASRRVPAGVLTIVLDSCFSGGMSKDPGSSIKARQLVDKASLTPRRYRPFGAPARANIGPFIAANTKLIAKLSDESGPSLNGLLISACLENETAAASTPYTNGLSAFTFGLHAALAELGTAATVEALMTRTTEILRSINIVQSPQLHPPATPDMDQRTLYLAEPLGGSLAREVDASNLLERVMTACVAALSVSH